MISKTKRKEYLKLTIKLVKKEINKLQKLSKKKYDVSFDKKIKKELKSPVDKIIERDIIRVLYRTNINILSEETGFIKAKDKRNLGLSWIVDPLDGTANFSRNLGDSGVSIALFEKDKPIFGVIGIFPSGDIYYGGKTFGSFRQKERIYVSQTTKKNSAIICTGFPVRLNFESKNFDSYINKLKSYAKVRMLGSAAVSLLYVANGSADAYFESDIMIWDIAAGIAILQGANGYINLKKGRFKNSHILFASNSKIKKL